MKITHHFGGGVYAKETHFEAGEWGEKHTHDYDHISILASGVVRLRIDEEVQELTGPVAITVKAGKPHTVMAMTPVVWYCIHATDCTDAEEIDNLLKVEA